MKTIGLDFNGVLDTYEGWVGGKEYPPREGAKSFLKSLKDNNFDIIILTSIEPLKVIAWLDKYGLKKYVSGVTNTKPPAFVYLDDRAVCFKGDFDDALEQIKNFKAHWEDDLPHL